MRGIIGGLLAAGLLLIGCGGTVAEEPGNLATREDELPSCRYTPCSPGWVCVGTTCRRGCNYPDSSTCGSGEECCLGYVKPDGTEVPPYCGFCL